MRQEQEEGLEKKFFNLMFFYCDRFKLGLKYLRLCVYISS